MDGAKEWLTGLEAALAEDDLVQAIAAVNRAGESPSDRRDVILLQGRLAALVRDERLGTLTPDAIAAGRARLRAAVFDMATTLEVRHRSADWELRGFGGLRPSSPSRPIGSGSAPRTESGSTFVSHTWADSDLTRMVVAQLEASDVEVWVDFDQLEPGDRLVRRVGEALRSCQTFLALISPAYIKGQWSRAELEIALSAELERTMDKVVAVVVPPATRPDVLAAFPLLTDRLVPHAGTGHRPLPAQVVDRIRRPPLT